VKGCPLDAVQGTRSTCDHPELSFRSKRRLRKIFSPGFDGYQEFLLNHMWRRGSLGHKGQLKVIDDKAFILIAIPIFFYCGDGIRAWLKN